MVAVSQHAPSQARGLQGGVSGSVSAATLPGPTQARPDRPILSPRAEAPLQSKTSAAARGHPVPSPPPRAQANSCCAAAAAAESTPPDDALRRGPNARRPRARHTPPPRSRLSAAPCLWPVHASTSIYALDASPSARRRGPVTATTRGARGAYQEESAERRPAGRAWLVDERRGRNGRHAARAQSLPAARVPIGPGRSSNRPGCQGHAGKKRAGRGRRKQQDQQPGRVGGRVSSERRNREAPPTDPNELLRMTRRSRGSGARRALDRPTIHNAASNKTDA